MPAITPFTGTVISAVFLLFGAVAIATMMWIQGRTPSKRAIRRLRFLHRASGFGFAGLFAAMFVFMMQRIVNYWEESSPRVNLHESLAVVLLLLITAKILIPRFFPRLYKHLFPLGITVYSLSFLLVVVTGGYYSVRKVSHKPYIAQGEPEDGVLDVFLGKELFIRQCSVCHDLQEIMDRRSAEEWEKVVDDMIMLAAPRINRGEAAQILYYLQEMHTPRPAVRGATDIERCCLPCHEERELFRKKRSQIEWRDLVQRMREHDSQIITERDVQRLASLLAADRRNQSAPQLSGD